MPAQAPGVGMSGKVVVQAQGRATAGGDGECRTGRTAQDGRGGARADGGGGSGEQVRLAVAKVLPRPGLATTRGSAGQGAFGQGRGRGGGGRDQQPPSG